MEVTVKGTTKEIADLVVKLQSQQKKKTIPISINVTNGNPDDLVEKYYQKWKISGKFWSRS